MRKILLVAALVAPTGLATAQTDPGWRLGITASLSTRLLNVDSGILPDSNTSDVRLGLGLGVEGARRWRLKSHVSAVGMVRLLTAPVNATTGGASWSPGRAFIFEAGGKIQREVGERFALFGGANMSHWSGPDNTAPFAGLGAVLIGTEAGFGIRNGDGPWHLDLAANVTRFPGDDVRGIGTGFVWRWMVGLRRER